MTCVFVDAMRCVTDLFLNHRKRWVFLLAGSTRADQLALRDFSLQSGSYDRKG